MSDTPQYQLWRELIFPVCGNKEAFRRDTEGLLKNNY